MSIFLLMRFNKATTVHLKLLDPSNNWLINSIKYELCHIINSKEMKYCLCVTSLHIISCTG